MTTKDTKKKTQKEAFDPTEVPLFLFHKGENGKAYEFFGSHQNPDGSVTFRVWAPHASCVSVIGSFNNWDCDANFMTKLPDGESFEATIEGVNEFDSYKYHITANGHSFDKADPYAFHAETRPQTASKVYNISGYKWHDKKWENNRSKANVYAQPMNIYEVHLGSWRTYDDGEPFSYEEMAKQLVPYVKEMGYTHVEFMPITEFPFDGSWGYQVTGYFAATSRFGTPKGLMNLIDVFHQNDIGVILDWVPGHFPRDAHGLSDFDGQPLYEYADSKKGEHKEWGTKVFDYNRKEVRSFLTSSASFWFENFHIDGLRVDAVASMLYLNYCRKDGEWTPNIYGGVENLEAVEYIRQLNSAINRDFPNRMMIAEESTSWPKVSKGISEDGLGFTFKWNMGWMNDCLKYFSLDGLSRKYNHNLMTFSMFYAFSENFVLPISHDEVVHGKLSLINRMPGSYEEKFAGARSFFGYMMSHPGKKLNMMGNEFGQFIEWKYDQGLDWLLLDYEKHRQLKQFVKDINYIYKNNKCFWLDDLGWDGFDWCVCDDNDNSVLAYRRMDRDGNEFLCVLNLTPVDRENYRIGVPNPAIYEVVLNSDNPKYGGLGRGTKTRATTKDIPSHGKDYSVAINIPGFSCMYFKKKELVKKATQKQAAKKVAKK